jgi:hypothetical protein
MRSTSAESFTILPPLCTSQIVCNNRFTMTDATKVKRSDIAKEDEDDNVEAALQVALPPPPLPSLERQAHHTPPGAFAMSLGATPQDVSGSMVRPPPHRRGDGRCRTNSCDTHATMSIEDEDDYLEEQTMHHVPVAELVVSTDSSMVSSLGPGGSFTNNARLYDVEIAQEVYGGDIIPSNLDMRVPSSDVRTTRQVWRRAVLLAVGMTLLLVAIVATAKAVRSSDGPTTGTGNTMPPLASNNINTVTNTSAPSQESPEDETSLLSTPPIVPCQDDDNATKLATTTEDSRLVCLVAEGIKNELSIPLNETKTPDDDSWEIICPDGRTILVSNRVRLRLCDWLAKGNATLSDAAAEAESTAANNETDSAPRFPLLQALLKRSIP